LEKNWVKIFSTVELHLIQIAQGLLEENNIESVVINKVDSSYPSLGVIELLVSKEDALKAIQIIKNINNE
jgi:hypothetical protein